MVGYPIKIDFVDGVFRMYPQSVFCVDRLLNLLIIFRNVFGTKFKECVCFIERLRTGNWKLIGRVNMLILLLISSEDWYFQPQFLAYMDGKRGIRTFF